MAFILWVLAVILVIAGIAALFRKQYLWGIVLVIIGFAVGARRRQPVHRIGEIPGPSWFDRPPTGVPHRSPGMISPAS